MRFCDTVCYVVDVRKEITRIIDIDGAVSDSLDDIKMAIACGIRLNYYSDLGVRPLGSSWTLGDLAENMELF